MREPNGPIRILLIRPWTEPLAPLRIALDQKAMTVRFHRIDIEPALNAALNRGGYDVVVFDPKTRGITREILDACMRANQRAFPIVTLSDPSTLPDAIRDAMRAQLN